MAHLVKNGNSQGIRIPNPLVDHYSWSSAMQQFMILHETLLQWSADLRR